MAPEPRRTGPPEIEHLVQRLEAEQSDEREPIAPDPAPDEEEDPDTGRARTLVVFLGMVVLIVIWSGPKLREPFDAVALISGASLCFLIAYLVRFLRQSFFMWINLGVGAILLYLGIDALLRY